MCENKIYINLLVWGCIIKTQIVFQLWYIMLIKNWYFYSLIDSLIYYLKIIKMESQRKSVQNIYGDILFCPNIEKETDGTSYQGMLSTKLPFERSVALIYEISGQKIFENGDGYKLTFHVFGKYKGQVFTLYDYKGDKDIHIGGFEELDVDGLNDELIKIMEKGNINPKKFKAVCKYTEEEYEF